MSATPPLSPTDMLPLAKLALDAVKDMPPEQQQAVLEAATAIARASVEMRQRLYLAGTLVASLNRK